MNTPAREGLPELPDYLVRAITEHSPSYTAGMEIASLAMRFAAEHALAAIAGREAQGGAARRLWALLDDIDTQDDASKGDDRHFREAVRRIQRKRFDVMTGEQFDALPHPQPGSVDVFAASAAVKKAMDDIRTTPPPPSDAAQGDGLGFGKLPECPPELESPPMTEEERTAAINRFKEKLLAAETEAPPSQPVRVDEVKELREALGELYDAYADMRVPRNERDYHRAAVLKARKALAAHKGEGNG